MPWPSPKYSRNQVRKTGKNIAKSEDRNGRLLSTVPDDAKVLENWQASHGAVLNSAQVWLHRLGAENRPIYGERLKRTETIVDKLRTGRSLDLSSMHDIAGTRLIFKTEHRLNNFREKIAESTTTKHEMIHAPEKFDYIFNPKVTGYRGVHQVYQYQAKNKKMEPWNNLRFEVQFRTNTQHSWATAIEVYDLTKSKRFKFENESDPAFEQFRISSELLARTLEHKSGCLPEPSDIQLCDRFDELEQITKMLHTFRSLKVINSGQIIQKNTILQISKSGGLNVLDFKNFNQAVKALPDVEKDSNTVNAVLVGTDMPVNIRDVFTNYFNDTSGFVDAIERSIRLVRGNYKDIKV